MLVATLTSIPPRFAQLPRVVAGLQAQGGARVVVTLPRQYRRFPGDHAVPDLSGGAEVLRPQEDLGPAAKILHAARALQGGQDLDLLYCDDDWAYGPGWVDAFRAARAAHPEAVLAGGATFGAARLKLSGPPIAQGFAGGVMIRPDWLDDIAMSPPPDIAWAVDDIWLSGALAARAEGSSTCRKRATWPHR